MRKVSIVGAGELGAGVAARLAAAGWAGEIVLFGRDDGPARGKALDLLQSTPILASASRLRAAPALEEVRDSRFVVVAGPGEEVPWETPALLQAIRAEAPDAVVIAAANDPAAFVARACGEGILAPKRIVGTAPAALASRWRLRLARALGCSARQVAVSLVGAPPRAGLYETFAAAGGVDVEQLTSVPEWRRVAREVAAAAAPGPRALAAAAGSALLDMALGGGVHSCYVWAQGVYGMRAGVLCAPVVLGSSGVERVIEVPLDPGRRVTVDRGIDFLSRG
jgi:malate dehydrogenase